MESGKRRRRVDGGFTLIELMVVAAIMVILMTITIPAISTLVKSNARAQADNTLRAALYSARTYAVHNATVAGIRCQDDGRIVQIYCRGTDTDSSDKRILDMKAVEERAPDVLPDPYRATFWDVGAYAEGYVTGVGDMQTRWIGPTYYGYNAPPEFLDKEHTWFAFPVVLFSPQGRVIFTECQFDGQTDGHGWFPTMTGSYKKVVYRDNNGMIPNSYNSDTGAGPNPSHDRLKYTNQVALAGWRCNGYKGSGSHDIPVEAPSITACIRLFDYQGFRAIGDPREAVSVIASSSSDVALEIETGMVVRR
jgi:prepilin-type N-terminal cleavage/methylation domain-containing protein